MNIKKNIISRSKALEISKDYVAYVEGDHNKFSKIIEPFESLKRGQAAMTFVDGQFILVKVSGISQDDFRAIDGPVVRVSNGEYSWRVDGDKYAFPV